MGTNGDEGGGLNSIYLDISPGESAQARDDFLRSTTHLMTASITERIFSRDTIAIRRFSRILPLLALVACSATGSYLNQSAFRSTLTGP
jgi:hypothetical protein